MGKGQDVADGDNESGFAALHGLPNTPGVGSDYRQAGCGGFEDADGKALPERREDESVGVGKKSVHIALEACEVDARLDFQFGSEAAQVLFFRSGPENFQSGLAGQDGECAKKGWIVLDGSQAADCDPPEAP